ncbi:MAG: polysaccharide biosynthesis tyrosine autokinase [Alphaproteobacteria bacterium]|nr:polysaccharide biosynthesis tyrosine autokinase [Alphaproteobacteria bacterium]
MKPLQDQVPARIEYFEDMGGAPPPSIDLFAILAAVLRRWKLIAAITLSASVATYGVVKLLPSTYKSTVEILVYDPQRQIDAAVQKPISPFVDVVGYDAMSTEINIIKSKSVALRVAKELGLDRDPEFQPQSRLAELAERLGFPGLNQADKNSAQTIGVTEDENAERLDQAADALLGKLQVWPESYIIFVSTTSQNPITAQRLASTIANDYLASQREARQEALKRVATWLKGRVDDLQSRVLETESSIEKLKAESGIRDTGVNDVSEQQIGELNTQLMTARAEVDEKRAGLEQARRVIDANGDIQSIPELTASAVLTELRQKQTELNWRAADLQNKMGERQPILLRDERGQLVERHDQVVAIRAELAGINKKINAEAEHILGNMKNAYDIALRRKQSLEANLQRLTATRGNPETYVKLQQLRHVANADRNLYESYLSQYNELAQRSTLQDASARVISAATLPRSPSSPRRKLFYALGGTFGFGGGFLLAFLLEYLRSGVKTGTEIEQSFGQRVVGIIPLVQHGKYRGTLYNRLLHRMVDEPLSHFSEAVHAMRISLELSSANPKVILITSALPAEGKSTAAMLLAASSASSGKRTVLLDCDLRQQSTSAVFRNKRQPGVSELLRGTAELMDVITKDPATKTYVIPAGSMVPNAADLLMSQRMRDLIAELRDEFEYIVMDTSPLLPVVDALALATVADKVLMIVEWGRTPHASISEAFKVLRPEAHRVAGIVLNKVDLNQLQGYGYRGGYQHRSVGKYFNNA